MAWNAKILSEFWRNALSTSSLPLTSKMIGERERERAEEWEWFKTPATKRPSRKSIGSMVRYTKWLSDKWWAFYHFHRKVAIVISVINFNAFTPFSLCSFIMWVWVHDSGRIVANEAWVFSGSNTTLNLQFPYLNAGCHFFFGSSLDTIGIVYSFRCNACADRFPCVS